MATTSKLELSLDEIIKANKQNEAKAKNQQKGFGARKGQAFKKRVIGGGTPQQKGRQFGRGRIGQQGKQVKFGTPKRRVVGVMRRKPFGGGINVGGRKPNGLRNNNQQQAVMSAAENLVKKLVRKALTQSTKGGIRGKFRRAQRTRATTATNLVLNKISARSRVIGRRPRVIANVQQQQPVIVQRVRGRGPVRYATMSAPVVMQTAVAPRRKFVPRMRPVNTVRYFQQQQQQPAAVIVQQQPVQQHFAKPPVVSVRDHLNALRRASTLQQLQAQFITQNQPQPRHLQQQQQQQPMQFVTKAMRVPRMQTRQQQQQQFIVQQQQPFQFQQQQRIRRRQPRQQQQQIIVAQQQPQAQFRRRRPQMQQQQFVVRQQFAGGVRRPRPQQPQQQFMFDPSYVPPNFLQRL